MDTTTRTNIKYGSGSIVFIGKVRSELTNIEMCPKQAGEGAPDGWIEVAPQYRDALLGVKDGDELMILTWFHLADRDTLLVHPRGNPENPLTGVFSTRSPSRPNPIGLHRVKVLEVKDLNIHVDAIEVLDKTPVIDIKIAIKNC